MSLRVKVFAALAFVYIALLGYLYAYWMPEASQRQSEVFRSLQARELKAVGEVLLPMVAAGQLGDIHDTLDKLVHDNPDWVAIELTDARGRRLYPLAGTQAPPTARHDFAYQETIAVDDRPLAELQLLVSEERLLANIAAAQRRLIAALALTTLGAMAFIALVLDFAVRRPISRLATAAHDLAAGQFDTPLPKAGGDEVGELVRAFARMRQEVDDTQENLRHLNETLEQRVAQEVAANRQKDHLLIQQSRLAAMGEMVHNIAHQWRQPLNALGLLLRNIRDDYDYGELTAESMRQATGDAQKLLQRMSTTIDDFREFFRPDKDKVRFDVAKAVRDALFIVEPSLGHYNIALQLDVAGEPWAEGFPSQFSQAVLNLLVNAKEAIVGRGQEDGRIAVRVATDGKRVRVVVEDNGGGIPAEVLPKVFDPYFTTKDKGSGIGLYMTKMIIEKNMDGEVAASNLAGGARFELAIPVEEEPHG